MEKTSREVKGSLSRLFLQDSIRIRTAMQSEANFVEQGVVSIGEDKFGIYTDVFQQMDTNQDGKISAVELRKALCELGHTTTLTQATKMVEMADENNDGMLELVEFVHMAERSAIWSRPTAEIEAMTAFQTFDIDNDGKISKDEVQEAMAKMGQPLTRKEAREMLAAMDKDSDGLISYREFLETWSVMMRGR